MQDQGFVAAGAAMPEKGEKSLSGAVSGLAENTGMHGLPNIYRSKSICRKSAWIIILLAGLGE